MKTVALLTCACFLLTSVLGQPAQALAERRNGAAQCAQALAAWAIPYTAGTVTAGRYYGDDRLVVAIQDLHCNPEVQKNIAALIALIAGRHAIGRIYLEGASGAVDTSWLSGVSDARLRKAVLESLVEKGRLTGVEYYAASTGKTAVFGLENKALHAANIARLNDILDARPALEERLAVLRKELQALEGPYYNARHRRFAAAAARYRQGSDDTKKYYRLLATYAKNQGIDLSGYRNFALFLQAMDMEKRLDYEATADELRQFLGWIKTQLPYQVYTALAAKTENFTRLDSVYPQLAQVADAGGQPLAVRFPRLRTFFAYLKASQRVNPVALIGEEKKLEQDIHLRFCDSESERDIVRLSGLFDLAEAYYLNRISYEEYRAFRADEDAFKLLWMTYTGDEKICALDRYAPLFDRFYEANIERNSWFLKNMGAAGVPARRAAAGTADETLRRLAAAHEVDVVVAGGFHTPGLAALLEERGISYVVITPNVTSENTVADATYARLAREQRSLAAQALALVDLSQETDLEKAQCVAGVLVPLLEEKRLPADTIAAEINAALQKIALHGGRAAGLVFSLRRKDDTREFEYTIAGNGMVKRFVCGRDRTGGVTVMPAGEMPAPAAGGAADIPPVASVLGLALARYAVLWEWVYAFPYANRLVKRALRAVAPALAARVGETAVSKKIDGMASLVLSGGVIASVLSGFWPAVILSSTAYAFARGAVFGAAHRWASVSQRYELSLAGAVLTMASLMPFIVPVAVPVPFLASLSTAGTLAAGVLLSVLLHWLYNTAGTRFMKRAPATVFPHDGSPDAPRIVRASDYPRGIGKETLAGLENAIIKGVVIRPDGYLYLAERKWVKHQEYAGKKVTVHVKNGFCVGVTFANGTYAPLTTIIDNSTGKVVECFGDKMGSQRFALMRQYPDVTLKDFTLNGSGRIDFGASKGKPWAHFLDRPGEMVDIHLQTGLTDHYISDVYFHKDGLLLPFALIDDHVAGGITGSFFGSNSLGEEEFARLRDATIRNFTLPPSGGLNLGNRPWGQFADRGRELADITVKEGKVTNVVFQKDGQAENFRVVVDNETGGIAKTFKQKIGKKLADLDKVTIAGKLGDTGGLFLGNRYWGTYASFPGADIEAVIENGKVARVRIIADRDGNPVPDVSTGRPLEIEPDGNIKRQILEKSRGAHERRLSITQKHLDDAVALLNAGERASAFAAFKTLIDLIRFRVVPVRGDQQVYDAARAYRKSMTDEMRAERSAELLAQRMAEANQLFDEAVALFNAGDTRKAFPVFEAVISKAHWSAHVPQEARAVANAARAYCRRILRDTKLENAEQYMEQKEYAEAIKWYRAYLHAIGTDSDEYGEIADRLQERINECRITDNIIKADALTMDGRYRQAAVKYKAALGLIEPGSALYDDIAAQVEYCEQQTVVTRRARGKAPAVKDDTAVFSIRQYYREAVALEDGKIQELLARIGEQPEQAAAARQELAESYMWLVRQIAEQYVWAGSEMYSEMIDEGFLIVNEAIDAYRDELAQLQSTFEEYVRPVLVKQLKAYKNAQYRSYYKEFSLQKKVSSGDDDRTWEDRLPAEEPLVDQTEEDATVRQISEGMEDDAVAVVRAVLDDGMSADEAAELMQMSVEQVKEILMDAVRRIRALSLGDNLKGLVRHALESVRETDPQAHLCALLAARSGALAAQVLALYRAGNNVTAAYLAYARAVAGTDGIDALEVRDSDYLIYDDAWSLATLARAAGGRATLLVHRRFMDTLRAAGPPLVFEPGADEETRAARFLALLARHELDEEAALAYRPGDSGALKSRPWLADFERFLAANRKARSAESFHAYIARLTNRKAALRDDERALAQQQQLLAFAKTVLRTAAVPDPATAGYVLIYDTLTGRLVDTFDSLTKEDLPLLTHHTVKGNVRADNSGKVVISKQHICKFSAYPGARVECDVTDGVVSAVRAMDGTAALGEKKLKLVFENKTGKLVDSFENATAEKLRGYTDHTIKNVFSSNDGRIELGNDKPKITAYPNAEVELLMKDGTVALATYVKDAGGNPVLDTEGNPLAIDPRQDIGRQIETKTTVYKEMRQVRSEKISEKRYKAAADEGALSVIYDLDTGQYVRSFATITLAELRALRHHRIKKLVADRIGEVNPGCYLCRFVAYPNAEMEVDVRNGYVVAARVVKENRVVDEKEYLRIYDAVSGDLVDASSSLTYITRAQLGRMKNHVIAGYRVPGSGRIGITSDDIYFQIEALGGATVDFLVRDGHIASVRCLSDRQGAPILDIAGNPLEIDPHGDVRVQWSEKSLAAQQVRETARQKERLRLQAMIDAQDENGAKRRLLHIYDNATGTLTGVCYSLKRSILDKLDDHLIKGYILKEKGKIELSAEGILNYFPYYPDAEVELLVKQGKIREIRFIKDKDGATILDIHGAMLTLDPAKNLRHQVLQKAGAAHETRAEQSLRLFEEAEQLFLQGDDRAARQRFAYLLKRIQWKRFQVMQEISLYPKAEEYLEICGRLMPFSDRRDGALSEAEKEYREAQVLCVNGQYGQACALLNEVAGHVPADMARIAGACLAASRANALLEIPDRLRMAGNIGKALDLYRNLLKETGGESPCHALLQQRIDESLNSLRLSSAVALLERGWHDRAERLFEELIADVPPAGDIYLLAQTHLAAIREQRYDKLLQTGIALFDRGRYTQATRYFERLIATAPPESEQYAAASCYKGECAERASMAKITTKEYEKLRPVTIRNEYAGPLITDVSVEVALFDAAGAGRDGSLEGQRKASDARVALAENYMWLVKQVAAKFAGTHTQYFEELADEGFLVLYDALDDYVAQPAASRPPFEAFATPALERHYKGIRSRNYRQLYGEVSLQKPVAGKDGDGKSSLQDFVADKELTAEEYVVNSEEDQRVLRMLRQFLDPDDRRIIWRVVNDGMPVAEVAEEYDRSPVEIKELLREALAAYRAAADDENGEQQAVGTAANAAARRALDVVEPLSGARALQAEIEDALLPPARGWALQNAAACIGKTYAVVFPGMLPPDKALLAAMGKTGVGAIGIAAGKPAGNAQYLCSVALPAVSGRRPARVKVWVQTAGENAALVFLESPYFDDAAGRNTAGLKLFGRAVLAFFARLGDDAVVAKKLHGLGLSGDSFAPSMVELQGASSVFALPDIVQDEWSGRFSGMVFGFTDTGSDRVLPAAEAQALGIMPAAAGDEISLARLGLAGAKVTFSAAEKKRRFPWLVEGITNAVLPENDTPAGARARLRVFGAGIVSRKAGEAERAPDFVARLRVEQLVPASIDRQAGAITDLAPHIGELKAAGFDTVQLQGALAGENPFLLDAGIIDWGKVAEAADGTAATGFDGIARQRDRYDAFTRFCRNNAAWLDGKDRQACYMQFIAAAQLEEAVRDAHQKGVRVLLECAVNEAVTPATAASAMEHWVRAGFDGVSIDLQRAGTVTEDWLAGVKRRLSRANPDVVIAVVPASGAERQMCRRLGIMAVERCGIEGAPPETDDTTWLEVAAPDTRMAAGDAARLEAQLKKIIASNAPYIALPDALQWGGTAGARNPSAGERAFDISDAVAAMIKRRIKTRPVRTLHGWRYSDGYEEGVNIPVPAAAKIDFDGLHTERQWRGAVAPGLHVFEAAEALLAHDRQLAAALPAACDADGGDFFALAFAALAGTKGLRENEWQKGWHYLRDLQKQALIAPDLQAKVACNLQLVRFMRGVCEQLAMERYAAAGGRRLLLENSDLVLFRQVVSLRDRWEIYGAQDQAPDAPVPGAVRAAYGDAVTGSGQSLGERLTGVGTAADARAVIAAVYLRALLAEDGGLKTQEELLAEVRAAVQAVCDAPPAPASPATAQDARAWGIGELLRIMALFEKEEKKLRIQEGVTDGAVCPLGVKAITGAA